ncbi:MAG: aminopeptidase P N-terminal domain-containing protein [Culicoidibacterales bacterium]
MMKQTMWQDNRQRYCELMPTQSVSIFFAGEAPVKSADEMYPFTPNRNFYYLTGLTAPNLVVVITKAERETVTVFIERENPEMARWIGATITAAEVQAQSGISDVRYLDELETFIGNYFNRQKVQSCQFDLERQSLQTSPSAAQKFAQVIQQAYPSVLIKDAQADLAQLRMVKSPAEIEKIEAAIQLTKQGILAMAQEIKPEMTENQVEAYFDFTLKQGGATDFAFPTICAGGKNATILHYNENNQVLNDGELVLFDLGAQIDYYNADISRTFPINGTFSKRQRVIYEIVLKAMVAVEQAVRPGITLSELNQIASDQLAEGCLAIGLITEKSQISQYYIHSIGHHLGLDTHDVSNYKQALTAGMVITNEPGLYIPEEGIGIRLEDDLLVTATGCRNLSATIPVTIEEIEALMRR